MSKRLPKSIRKYIRQEKARIRREVLDIAKQRELIDRLYSQFLLKVNSTKADDKVKIQNAKVKMTNQNLKL